MGNTASDRKREMAHAGAVAERVRRESLQSAPGTPPATARHKQKLLIQQSMNDDSDTLSSLDESGTIDQRGIVLTAGRPRATTISHPPEVGSLPPPAGGHRSNSTSNEPSNLPTVFRYKGGGKQVYIAGDWNNWKTKIPLNKSQSDFVTILELPEGVHQYRFYVDGQWVVDPEQKQKEADGGIKANVVEVSRSDFEVFDALAMDGEKGSISSSFGGTSPPGSYSQEIPNKKPYETSSGPPILPPHLMQVILNRDIPVSCEPSLLPEPNHVMLNHLYALSIKDGVMVLSATHRFRKKYVTTLMYKPIS